MQPVVNNLVDVDSPPQPSLPAERNTAGYFYPEWCIYRLREGFPRVRLVDLRSALKFHRGKLAPAYMAVLSAHQNAILKEQKLPPIKKLRREKWLPYTGLKLMKVGRKFPTNMPDTTCPFFERDWAILQAELPNRSIAQPEVKMDEIECGCCCADVPFEEMVQCADGHLFCFTCLRRRVEESTFGALPACGPISCIDMSGCDKTIPWSEIKRAIQAELLLKFEQRQANDCVARAKLQGLVYCPFCNFSCEVDEGILVLKCPEKSCLKESCMKCKEPSHLPLRCEEVEKPLDTRNRNQIEEIMSKSLLRQCTACKMELIKDDGCNKITCRCGQSICYICRKAITDYKHFCEHCRTPGERCNICTKCSLWEQEDENAVVMNAKRAAIESRAKEDASILAREIGPGERFFANKRQKRT